MIENQIRKYLSRTELQNGSYDQKLQSQTKTEIRCWNCNGIGHLQFNGNDQNGKYNKYKPGAVSKNKSGKLDNNTKLIKSDLKDSGKYMKKRKIKLIKKFTKMDLCRIVT